MRPVRFFRNVFYATIRSDGQDLDSYLNSTENQLKVKSNRTKLIRV